MAWPCCSRNNAGEVGLCGIYNHQDGVGREKRRKKAWVCRRNARELSFCPRQRTQTAQLGLAEVSLLWTRSCLIPTTVLVSKGGNGLDKIPSLHVAVNTQQLLKVQPVIGS